MGFSIGSEVFTIKTTSFGWTKHDSCCLETTTAETRVGDLGEAGALPSTCSPLTCVHRVII